MVVVYIYLAVCILILFYTLFFIFYQWYDKKRQIKYEQKYISMILKELDVLKENFYIDRKHIEILKRQLRNVNKLIAFENALIELGNREDLPLYLAQLERAIKSLTRQFQNRKQMEQAFLASFIAEFAAKGSWHDPAIYKTLVSYLDDATIFLRENVLLATYQQPDPKWIISVFHYLSENNLFHHPKLIQDGLLNYPYNSDQLIDELWKNHESFKQSVLLGLIGYITFKTDRYKEIFYHELQKEELDIEVKIRLIRYFKRHHYPDVEPLLISFAKDPQDEIRIVTVQSLSEYRSEQVLSTLKEALKDSNYYVRRNASESLLSMGISEDEVLDILTGDDRYAKEMLRYQLNQKGGKIYELNH